MTARAVIRCRPDGGPWHHFEPVPRLTAAAATTAEVGHHPSGALRRVRCGTKE